jgi:hypothetical protein
MSISIGQSIVRWRKGGGGRCSQVQDRKTHKVMLTVKSLVPYTLCIIVPLTSRTPSKTVLAQEGATHGMDMDSDHLLEFHNLVTRQSDTLLACLSSIDSTPACHPKNRGSMNSPLPLSSSALLAANHVRMLHRYNYKNVPFTYHARKRR